MWIEWMRAPPACIWNTICMQWNVDATCARRLRFQPDPFRCVEEHNASDMVTSFTSAINHINYKREKPKNETIKGKNWIEATNEWTNEWRYAIGFQSMGQPHECKLSSSKTENVYYYVQFWCRLFFLGSPLCSTTYIAFLGRSLEKMGTKMKKKTFMESRSTSDLAWAYKTRKINTKIPFSISSFFFYSRERERERYVGRLRLATLGRENLARQKDQQNIILCISSGGMCVCVLHNLSIKITMARNRNRICLPNLNVCRLYGIRFFFLSFVFHSSAHTCTALRIVRACVPVGLHYTFVSSFSGAIAVRNNIKNVR